MMREGISTRPTDKYGNRATNADLGIGPGADAKRKAAAEKIMAREGTTNPSGGRPAVKMPAKVAPAKMPNKLAPAKVAPAKMPNKLAPTKMKPAQITRTTTNFKPSPTGKKR